LPIYTQIESKKNQISSVKAAGGIQLAAASGGWAVTAGGCLP